MSLFKIGDLVAEDYSLYWYFHNKSYNWIANEADPSEGEPKQVIGIVMDVRKRYPDQFFDIPYFVYHVKWFNPPQGANMDARYFYEDELVLLSRAHGVWEEEEFPDDEGYDENW